MFDAKRFLLTCAVSLSLYLPSAFAASTTIDFEGVADSTAANSLYSGLGLTFSGGLVVISGAFGGSLNEAEFPPQSGAGVFLNDADTTTISFLNPITSFSAFFTYGGPVTLNFYNASNALLTSVLSTFNTNVALSGDPGSLPNEELAVASLASATRLDLLIPNADFTMDDLTVNSANVVDPEPATLSLAAIGILLLVLCRQRRVLESLGR